MNPLSTSSPPSPLRLLLVAYEFVDPIFSGNGTYGRTIVEALTKAACHDGSTGELHVDVIAAVPVDDTKAPVEPAVRTSLWTTRPDHVRLFAVPVRRPRWGRHDMDCDWLGFAEGCRERAAGTGLSCSETTQGCLYPSYDIAAAVDWHGFYAMQRLLSPPKTPPIITAKRWCYLNFRVFANSLLLPPPPIIPPVVENTEDGDKGSISPRSIFDVLLHGDVDAKTAADMISLALLEIAALNSCHATVVLSSMDKSLLEANVRDFTALLGVVEDAPTSASDGGSSLSRKAIREKVVEALNRLWPDDTPSSSSDVVWWKRWQLAPNREVYNGIRVSVVQPPVRDQVLACAKLVTPSAFPDSPKPHPSCRNRLAADDAIGTFVEEHLPPSLKSALETRHASSPTRQRGRYRRRFVTCCVRQARDKNPQRFVELIERLAAAAAAGVDESCNFFSSDAPSGDDGGFIPLFLGSAPEPEFSAELRRRLTAACPRAVCLTDFVSTEQLMAIFYCSSLNVHPCLYDAFGLTIVEAAVCGCPSLIHDTAIAPQATAHVVHAIGAAELLQGHFYATDFTDDRGLLEKAKLVLKGASVDGCDVGSAAQSVAVAYNTKACGEALLRSMLLAAESNQLM